MDLQTAIKNKTKDKLFVSLALKPGTTGTKFYSKLFEFYNIDAEYVACECTDIERDLDLVRQHCAGASITMPYKKPVAELVDKLDPELVIPAINTVKNNKGTLTGYNCDYRGLAHILPIRVKNKVVVILGDGAMADNVEELCKHAHVFQFSRNMGNWEHRELPADILINTTSIGMDMTACPVDELNADMVIDCVIGATPLIKLAKAQKKQCVTGADIYLAQLRHQFAVYTGIMPNKNLIASIAGEVFK